MLRKKNRDSNFNDNRAVLKRRRGKKNVLRNKPRTFLNIVKTGDWRDIMPAIYPCNETALRSYSEPCYKD